MCDTCGCNITHGNENFLKPGGKLLVVDYAFNKRTNSVAKVLIRAIEFMAGRRHFTNFLHYNHKGGLEQLVDPRCFVPIKDRFHGQRSIVVRMLQKKD